MSASPGRTTRAFNRSLLARQMLLERDSSCDTSSAVQRLVGMQAQLPRDPHIGLWSRLRNYDTTTLDNMLQDRDAVRTTLMRGTIHLVTADDALTIWPLLRDQLRRVVVSGARKRALASTDVDALLVEGSTLLRQPMTRAALRNLIAERHPQIDTTAAADAISGATPTVQIPPRGLWQRSMAPTLSSMTEWLGSQLAGEPSLPDLVVRYLRAYGPATPADFQAWSGLTRTAEVFAALGSALVTVHHEDGTRFYDVADAPWPDESTPAPVRFLPVYDNAILGFADRSRIMGDKLVNASPLFVGLNANYGSFLVDGFLGGLWRDVVDQGIVTLTVQPIRSMTTRHNKAVVAEAEQLLVFLAAGRPGALQMLPR